jgi:hypothetical protein
MNQVKKPFLFLAVALTMLLTACQQQLFVSGGRLGLRDYPDAVVHINQVDPAYRAHFAQQHGASYSLSDQRKAFSRARETARTPVRESAYRPAQAAPRKKSARSQRKASSRGKKSAARGKKSTRGKKTATKGKNKKSKKSTSRRRR